MVKQSPVAAARTEALPVPRQTGLSLSGPLAQALASALAHFATRSKQLETLKKHLFEGQPYKSNQQWFGVNVRSPLVLEEQEMHRLHALLRDVAEISERAQSLLARLENRPPTE